MTVLDLPKPPSVNAIYRNVPGKGRAKTKVYAQWIEAAGWLLKIQRPKPVPGPYTLHIAVGPTRADLDNLAKGLSDLLQRHGVIDNDRKAESVHLERSTAVPKGQVRCTVSPAVRPVEGWTSLGEAAASVVDSLAKQRAAS